jgi:hypothetical protein
MEAILIERMSGFPVVYVPSSLIDGATATANGQPSNPAAVQALEAYKKLVTSTRVNDQMGAILPSDTYRDATGNVTNVRMYEFKFETPAQSRGGIETDKIIGRHKLDMLMTLLADFVVLGHEVRGTNNLAVTKVDMFFGAIEGWLNGLAAVLNRYALPRLWEMNGLNPDLMPQYEPDLAQRVDLDGLGTFIGNLAAAGMPLFPDDELERFLRESAGLPEVTDPEATPIVTRGGGGADAVKRMLLGAVARQIKKMRAPVTATTAVKRTLYVHRKLQNADSVIAWAKEQGFATTLARSDMHVTVAHSRTPVDWSAAGENGAPVKVDGGMRALEKLGDKGAVVLRFESGDLSERHGEFRKVGASWDWPSYKPHITLTYDAGNLDLEKVEPYSGPLMFGPERFAEVNEDWADQVREQ